MTSRLDDLFPDSGLSADAAARPVTGLTQDSRAVAPGFVFFAVPGHRQDGRAYVADALGRGAVAIVSEAPLAAEQQTAAQQAGAQTISVADLRASLAAVASAFYPGQPKTIVAVTGTSGKTSVASFARQIWAACGEAAASLGTIGVEAPGGAIYGALTTPDPVALHQTLDRLARDGVTHLAMEASSHGIHQKRLDGVRLAAGAFTNLSRDHLDYHGDMDSYFAAKARLFDTLLQPGQPAVIDADSDVAQRMIAVAEKRGLSVFTTGVSGAGLHLDSAVPDGAQTLLRLTHAGLRYDVRLPLAGSFMVWNALLAAGLCLATGSDPASVLVALEKLVGAPGRLERVGLHNGAPVFVDYAHKPDALDKVLLALRPLASGRLIVVFGCGGDRDAGKRPLMGAIAVARADMVIVTDDNPRSEDPAAIRAAILAGAPGAIEIGDRAEAIRSAVATLRPGDVLVVAGKGHETGQIVGTRVLPFSDHEAVRTALAERAA